MGNGEGRMGEERGELSEGACPADHVAFGRLVGPPKAPPVGIKPLDHGLGARRLTRSRRGQIGVVFFRPVANPAVDGARAASQAVIAPTVPTGRPCSAGSANSVIVFSLGLPDQFNKIVGRGHVTDARTPWRVGELGAVQGSDDMGSPVMPMLVPSRPCLLQGFQTVEPPCKVPSVAAGTTSPSGVQGGETLRHLASPGARWHGVVSLVRNPKYCVSMGSSAAQQSSIARRLQASLKAWR